MQRQSLSFVICLLFLPEIFLVAGQDNSLTFSPSTPLCVGDVVQMICYVVPPTSQQFDSSAPLIAFNRSIPANPNDININDVTGVDTSRYTTDVSGLTVSPSRPGIRLTISPYQASDGATNFSCHGAYVAGIPSYSLISEYPQELAEPISLSDTNAKISFQILKDLSISVNATLLSQIERNDNLNYTYTLEYNTLSETSSHTQDNSYTFVTHFTCDVCYRVSYTAENCAGGSGTVSSGKFGLHRVRNTTGYFTQIVSDSKQIEWRYNELLCGSTEENYLPDEYFEFSLVNRVTGEISNISNSSLNFPYGFFVDIPQNIDITTTDYDLDITFIDPCFDVAIPINIAATTTSSSDILPIIIGCVAGVGAILLILSIILFLIVLYVCCIRNGGSQGDRVELAAQLTPDTQPEATYAQVNKPSPSQKKAPPPPNLIYAVLDMSASTSARVNASSIPSTNYSDISQLPDHTTYAAVD